MNQQTSPRLIFVVVVSIAILSVLGVITLSYCIITGIDPDDVLMTAYVGITTGLIGTLSGLLVNTRTNHAEPSDIATEDKTR